MVRGQRHSLGRPEAPLLRHPSFCLKSPAAAFPSARDGFDPFEPWGLTRFFSAVQPCSCHSSRCVIRWLLATRPWFWTSGPGERPVPLGSSLRMFHWDVAGGHQRSRSCLGGPTDGFRFVGVWTTSCRRSAEGIFKPKCLIGHDLIGLACGFLLYFVFFPP